jgi:2-hydroxycyclohexanecarboxyl-CoA dehydrogenase
MAGDVALVTGAGSGLGRDIAHRLARDGFTIAIAELDPSSGEQVAKEIESEGGTARAFECDVSQIEAVTTCADAIGDALGGIDVLVNNAGFDSPNFFLNTEPALWDRLIAVNLMGVLNCIYVLAPRIAERQAGRDGGRIINIASDAGRVGALGEAVYSAAKGGVIAFTKSMARELARDKITVNAVCPGPAVTPMTDAINQTDIGKMMMERIIKATPLRRFAEPQDVSGAVAYFASPEARFVTGQAISISGGLTMHG